MSAKFPEVRSGLWKYSFADYVFLSPDSDPTPLPDTEFIVNVRKNKDNTTAFFFGDTEINPGTIDAILNWKEKGNRCYNEAYLIFSIPLISGWLELKIKKKDKSKRVTGFVGNFIQGGPEFPAIGYVKANWIPDKEISVKQKNNNNKFFDLLKKQKKRVI